MGAFTIFQTSLRALNAYSGAMGVIANNVANAGNENYARQKVSFATLSPDKAGGIETGRGVELSDVYQVVDKFVEDRFTQSTMKSGQYQAASAYLKTTESVFNEVDGSGLSSMMGQYFDSMVALSAEPESLSVRSNVLTAGQNIAERFNEYGNRLNTLRSTIDLEIKGVVPEMNNLLQQIKSLNTQIQETPTSGLTFKDQRREAINKLAKYIDVRVLEIDDGSVQIYTKAGNPLLNGISVAQFSLLPDVTNNNLYDVYSTIGDTTGNITDTIQEGTLRGLLDVRDSKITGYKDKLDEMAFQFATEVNNLHTTGFDLNGNTGKFFFTNLVASADASTTIALSSDVAGNPSGLAISADAADVPGGNDIALSIADLADSTSIAFPTSGVNSFFGFYGDFLAQIGNDSNLANNLVSFQDGVLHQVNLERNQASGVNVDEEQIDLVKFQAAYEAAGRLVKVADTVLNTLLDVLR